MHFCDRMLKLTDYRGVEKLASRKAHNLEVGGSSPPPATKKLESDRLIFAFRYPAKFLFAILCQILSGQIKYLGSMAE